MVCTDRTRGEWVGGWARFCEICTGIVVGGSFFLVLGPHGFEFRSRNPFAHTPRRRPRCRPRPGSERFSSVFGFRVASVSALLCILSFVCWWWLAMGLKRTVGDVRTILGSASP